MPAFSQRFRRSLDTDVPHHETRPSKPSRYPTMSKRGLVADDDPIYTGGWNFIAVKNLNPNLARTEEPSPKNAAPLVPTVPDS